LARISLAKASRRGLTRARWCSPPLSSSTWRLCGKQRGSLLSSSVKGCRRPFMTTKARDEEKTSSSGIEMKPVFRPDDCEIDYERDLNDPGRYPFTRGPYATMYRGRLWTMRQYAGYATAAESNARFRYLLAQGQTGLSVAFDLPTQMGFDSDHQMARGQVGKVGVA